MFLGKQTMAVAITTNSTIVRLQNENLASDVFVHNLLIIDYFKYLREKMLYFRMQ